MSWWRPRRRDETIRGDVPEKLGHDFKSLKAVKPDIVCAHLSAYGRDGPRKTWPGYDYLMQAEAGWFSVTGEPDDLQGGLVCPWWT